MGTTRRGAAGSEHAERIEVEGRVGAERRRAAGAVGAEIRVESVVDAEGWGKGFKSE